MRHHENWLKAYLDYTRHLEAPDKFHFWSGVATIAGALQGKVWFDMGFFKWRPNFFIIYVAPPGIVQKSTTIGVGVGLLRELESIYFGPDSCTWQAVTDAFSEASHGRTMKDGTIFESSPITVAASELGTFLDPRNREMIDVLVDLWDGRPVPWKRRTRSEGEVKIPNPWFNFVGCTTPKWIEENFPEYAIGGGFTSRTVFLYGDKKRQITSYPKKKYNPYELEQFKSTLIEDLKQIENIEGEYDLTDDAYVWGDKWYHDLWFKKPEHLDNDQFSGYVSRKQAHIHKLAMIITAAQNNGTTITKKDLMAANELLTSIEYEMPRVFSSIADNPAAKFAAAVLTIVRRKGKISYRNLWRLLFNQMSKQEFDQSVNAIVTAGYAKPVQEDNDLFIVPLQPQEKPEQSHGTQSEMMSRSADPAPAEPHDGDVHAASGGE